MTYEEKYPGLVEHNKKFPRKRFSFSWAWDDDLKSEPPKKHANAKKRAMRKAQKQARRVTRFLDKSKKYDIRGRKSL